MVYTIAVGLMMFLVVAMAIAGAPLDSGAAAPLDGLGHALIGLGENAIQILQLPVTLPIYLIGQHHSLAAIERAAMHDRSLWVAAVMIWAGLAIFFTSKPARPSADRRS